MKGKKITLRRQFTLKVLTILLIVVVCTGAIQLFLMKEQIDSQTTMQSESIANNVLRGIEQTDVAEKAIEKQIDLKMEAISSHIATLMAEETSDSISNEELIEIRDTLGLAGITIFQESESNDDIIATKSTEEREMGFSLKQFGYYDAGKTLLNGEEPTVPQATLSSDNYLALPLAPSGSSDGEMKLYKYVYFHIQGTDFVINPYIEANEVYNYTKEVGPQVGINNILEETDIVKEIAILNPRVFADPSLEEQLYPPLKKIESGSFDLMTDKDVQLLEKSSVDKESYIETINGNKVFKMFFPYDESRVVYLALDYDEMTSPLYRHSIILIVFGIIGLIILFILSTRFFNQVYENIQRIKRQMSQLEKGDLTAKSEIRDGSEMELLSEHTNQMVDNLNRLVTDTSEQAAKTQRLSLLLESEASQSVEEMYEISTYATMKSRDGLNEIFEFLEEIQSILLPYSDKNSEIKELLDKVERIKKLVSQNTSFTTDMTIQLSDLVKSLHNQSSQLSDISDTLLKGMSKFKL